MLLISNVAHEDADLTGVDFAPVPTPLAFDADRMGAALGETTRIEGENAIGLGWDRNTVRATVGRSLAVSAFPRYVPVSPRPSPPFPSAPRLIPDGRMSRVRLATRALPAPPSPCRGSSRARPQTPHTTRCADRLDARRGLCPTSSGSVSCVGAVPCPLCPSVPWPGWGVPPSRRAWTARSVGAPRPSALLRPPAPDLKPLEPSAGALGARLCRVLRGPAGAQAFPAFSPQSFPQLLGPLPRRFSWCPCPFLPRRPRPAPTWERLGTTHPCRTATAVRGACSRLQTFTPVQASGCARHPGRTSRRASSRLGAAVALTSAQRTVCSRAVPRIG